MYLAYFAHGEDKISMPILSLFQEKGLNLLSSASFWYPFTRYLKMYSQKIDIDLRFGLTNGWGYILDENSLQLVQALNRCYPNFWIMTDSKQTDFDFRVLDEIKLGELSVFDVIETLFEQLSHYFPWVIFPWGDGNGQSCFCFLTQETDFIEEFEKSAFDPSYGFQEKPVKSSIAVKYDVIEKSFRSYCKAILFDDSRNNFWKKMFYEEFDLVNNKPKIIYPSETKHNLKGINIKKLGEGIFQVQTQDAFIELCNKSLEDRQSLFICPHNTSESSFNEIRVFREDYFLYDIQLSDRVDWLLTSGRSGGDNCHLNFISEKKDVFNKSYGLMKNNPNDVHVVSFY